MFKIVCLIASYLLAGGRWLGESEERKDEEEKKDRETKQGHE